MARGLTKMRQAFIDVFNGNITESAIAAGYSPKSAHSIGSKLLKNVEIQEAIKARQDKRLSLVIASREQRQAFWSEVMNDENLFMKDRLRASELLGRSEGDFLDRHEITGPNGGGLSIKWESE